MAQMVGYAMCTRTPGGSQLLVLGCSGGHSSLAGAWIAYHLWEHYLFTGDRAFLKNRAYPVLKSAAQFFLDYMVPDPERGWLVTGPSISPENQFLSPDGKRCQRFDGANLRSRTGFRTIYLLHRGIQDSQR
jgi:hypothetical protein